MTAISWTNAVSANFNVAGDWTPMQIPGGSDDVTLAADGGGAYTVSVNSTTGSETVNSLATAANATLSVIGATFTETSGTGAGVNAGTISVGDSGTFKTAGTFDNSGVVDISSYNPAQYVLSGNTMLTGGGQVVLVDGGYAASNALYGATAATTLTNVNNTISGAGALGDGQLTLINQAMGVIDATGTSHQLVLNTGSNAITNAGLIESTSSPGLMINGTTVNNGATGVIEANGASALLDLNSADIIGGTLKNVGGGVIQTTDRGSVLDGTTTTVNNTGTMTIAGTGTTLSLKGTINNTGAFSITSYNASQLIIAANTTLTGGGQVTMNDGGYAAANLIEGAAASDTLTNTNNTIQGAGALGGGQLTLVNSASGVIDANGTSHQMVLNTGSNAVANSGLIEATSAPGLSIVGTTINNATTGLIEANGASAAVDLQSAVIVGGTLTTPNGGVIQTTDGGSLLDGLGTHKVYVLGNLLVAPSTSLTIQGNIELTQKVGKTTTNGTITLNSYNPSKLIVSAKNATITGSQVDMLEGGYGESNQIIGTLYKSGKTSKVSTLSNSSTIVGVGTVGTDLLLTNTSKGVIDATGASHALILATGDATVAKSNILKNSGLIESTNPTMAASVGGLTISNTEISNAAKTSVIEANGANTHVDLQTATITGGTLETVAGGKIQTVDYGSILDGSTPLGVQGGGGPVNNKGTILIADNGTSLSLKGAINNTGVISITSYNASQLIMAANTTLTGGGAVTMNDGGYGESNQITGVTGATSLTNVDNTISGAGQLGAGSLTLINGASGVIDATGASHQLVINTGSVAVTNDNLIEATGAAGLLITGTTIANAVTGKIQANASVVDLTSATIAGGTLSSPNGGYFATQDHGSVLDGTNSTVNNQATINIADSGTSLSLKGAINNTGVISITSYNTSQLIMAANTTLSGGGQVIMNEGTYAASTQIYGANGATSLTNVDNTVSGAGQLGAGQLTLINDGTVDANGASHALVVNTGSVSVSNAGLMEATAAGGLSVTSAVANSGTMLANGGNVSVTGAITGAGTDSIKGSSVFEAGAADSNTVSFDAASTGTLKLDQSQLFTGTVTGMSTGKTMDLANISFATASLIYSGATTSGTLTVKDGATTATINMTGNYSQANFHLSNDGSNHTDVTYSGTGMITINRLAEAMASMGAGSVGSAAALSGPPHPRPTLLATPHA